MVEEISSEVIDFVWPFAAAFLVSAYIGLIATLSHAARHE